MRFLENLKSAAFWKRVFILGGIFFVVFVVISLLLNQFGNIISGEFAEVFREEWADGKWVDDLLLKGAVSFIWAIYMVSRRQRLRKDVPYQE